MSILERRNYYGLKAVSELLKSSFKEFRQATDSVGIFTLADETEVTTNIVQSNSRLFETMNKYIPDIPNIAYVYSQTDGKLFTEVSGSILKLELSQMTIPPLYNKFGHMIKPIRYVNRGNLINPPFYLLNFNNIRDFVLKTILQVGLAYQGLIEKSIGKYVIGSISIHETYDEPYYVRIGNNKYKVSTDFIALLSPTICESGNNIQQMTSEFVTFFNTYSGIEPLLPTTFNSPLETLLVYCDINPVFKSIFETTVEKLPLSEVDNIMGIQPVVIPSIQKYLFLRKPLPDNYLDCFKPTANKETNAYYAEVLKTIPNTENIIYKLTGYLPITKSRKFMITGHKGLYFGRLRHYLKSFKAEETFQVPTDSIFFLWTEGRGPELKCFMRNRVDGHSSITQRYNLYTNMVQNFPNELVYITKTGIVEKGGITGMKFEQGKRYIVRQSDVRGITGSSIISKQSELLNAYLKAIQSSNLSSPVLISEYVDNIQLYQGKKFFLRVYFMVAIINGEYKTSTFDKGEIFIAEKDYVRESNELSVIGKHGSIGQVQVNMDKYGHEMLITAMLSSILQKTIKLYKEAENAFEVFAVDLVLRDNNIPFIMSVKSDVDFKFNTGAVSGVPFSDELFKWINDNVLSQTMW